MPYDVVDRSAVHEMVRAFYATILKDEMLAPIFTKALGNDIKGGKWHEHLNTLDNFWLMMMTGERGNYGGHPYPPHAFLGPLTREHFERWLELFRATIDQYFVPEIADKFYEKADILAEQFIENLGIDEDDDDDW